MNGLTRAFHALAIYVVILVLGLVYLYLPAGSTPGTAPLITRGWWIQALLALFSLYYARRYFGWAGAGFGCFKIDGMIWLFPAGLVLLLLLIQLTEEVRVDSLTAEHWRVLGLIAVTTFLIGVSEEVMFRGILLRGALQRMGVLPAMLLSAAAFSLLHTVNLLGGLPFWDLLTQLGFTFLVGVFLAPLALVIGNLWPLIIWHWLWDMAIFSSTYLNVIQPLALSGILVQVVIGGWLWGKVLRAYPDGMAQTG